MRYLLINKIFNNTHFNRLVNEYIAYLYAVERICLKRRCYWFTQKLTLLSSDSCSVYLAFRLAFLSDAYLILISCFFKLPLDSLFLLPLTFSCAPAAAPLTKDWSVCENYCHLERLLLVWEMKRGEGEALRADPKVRDRKFRCAFLLFSDFRHSVSILPQAA